MCHIELLVAWNSTFCGVLWHLPLTYYIINNQQMLWLHVYSRHWQLLAWQMVLTQRGPAWAVYKSWWALTHRDTTVWQDNQDGDHLGCLYFFLNRRRLDKGGWPTCKAHAWAWAIAYIGSWRVAPSTPNVQYRNSITTPDVEYRNTKDNSQFRCRNSKVAAIYYFYI